MDDKPKPQLPIGQLLFGGLFACGGISGLFLSLFVEPTGDLPPFAGVLISLVFIIVGLWLSGLMQTFKIDDLMRRIGMVNPSNFWFGLIFVMMGLIVAVTVSITGTTDTEAPVIVVQLIGVMFAFAGLYVIRTAFPTDTDIESDLIANFLSAIMITLFAGIAGWLVLSPRAQNLPSSGSVSIPFITFSGSGLGGSTLCFFPGFVMLAGFTVWAWVRLAKLIIAQWNNAEHTEEEEE